MVATVVLATAAVVLVARGGGGGAVEDFGGPPEPVEGWEDHNAEGRTLGDLAAPVVITEFVDYQCPFCREFQPTLDSLVALHPRDLRVVVHHLPLQSIHPDAITLAIAAECAARSGAFWPMHRALLLEGETGVASPRDIALRNGIVVEDGFDSCLDEPLDSFPRIRAGLSLAATLGINKTPTIWLNGIPIVDRSFAFLSGQIEEMRDP